MCKKQRYYTLRKDYTIKVEKWNKIFNRLWKNKFTLQELELMR